MPDLDARRVPVLVAGAGTAGLITGLMLARYGVEVLLVEKRSGISTLSRALVLSTRSVEILRRFGLEDEVRAASADIEPLGWMAPTLAAAATEGHPMPLGHPTHEQAAKISPSRPAWASQDQVEPLLLAALCLAPVVTIRFDCELVTFQQDGGGVRATLRDTESDRACEVHAEYLIGADGARGIVRETLGIDMSGPGELGEYQAVDFRAPLAPVLGDRSFGLAIITHPDAQGILARRGAGDLWHYGVSPRPGSPKLVDRSEQELTRQLATAAGVPGLEPDVVHMSAYSFGAQIADRYRDGRVFLAGDSAHRMTPRGGTGMNTAIQDAYDLGWKLGWVLRGWAGPDLLDSYEAERRPVGEHNVIRSADANGAKRQTEEALPWDLNGRMQHLWLEREGRRVSTLDLLGDGLTLFTAAAGPGQQATAGLDTRVPVTVHVLDAPVAEAIGVPAGGAVLMRPDGKPYLVRTAGADGWSIPRA